MRMLLLSAAAAAPLLLLAAGPAAADTTVNSTTSQVQTSTANNGQPDNVIVGSGATVNVNGANTAAVIQNSNNTITNNGTISINASSSNNNTQAVLLNGGFTMPGSNGAALTNGGTINNTDGYTATTNSTNGYADGPFAQGSDRYGVQLVGSSPLVGSISLNAGSTITVQGNNSFGVSLQAPLTGDFVDAGSTSITGSKTAGVSVTAPVSGKVQISGAVSATGDGSTAVNIQGDIGGPLSIYSSLQSTGYRNTSRNPDNTINNQLTAAQVTQSNSAVIVGGNLNRGFFLGSAPAGTVSGSTLDADNDGIVDASEGAGSITTFSSAPALLIGSASRNVTVGLSPFGAQQNTYGMILEGPVTANGVYDSTLTFPNASTIPAIEAVQVGGLGGAVAVDGGISVTDTSTVTAQAYQQSATAIHLGAGASTPLLNNAGTIAALSTETTSTTPFTTTGLQIDQGASLQAILNTGSINSTLTGDTGSAYGIVDSSGTVKTVVNMGTITTAITPALSTDKVTGSTVAINLGANTSGVTLVQEANPNPVTNPTSATDSHGNPITFATTVSPSAPSITGDILLGTGADTVQFTAGKVQGALSMGSGSILIDGGAAYAGKLTTTGPISLNVNNGSFEDDNAVKQQVTSLTVAAKGQLTVAADPVNNTATDFLVSGQANLASGAQLNVKLLSLLPAAQQTYTVIQTAPGALTIGSTSSLSANTPYLYVAQFTADPTAGTLDLALRPRTPAEANLNRAETAAWQPVFANLSLNSGIERAFLAQTTAAGYRAMLNQVLPDYAGGLFRALSWANEQQGIAAGDPPLGEQQQGPTRAWTQEIVLDENKQTDQTAPYHILGVGMEAGLESVSARGDALGVKLGFVTANINNPEAPGDNLLGVSEINGGVYWRGYYHGLQADAQLGAGFIWANDRREFLYSDSQGVVHDTALSNWAGYTLSGRVGLQYTATVGAFFLEPRVHADYFRLHESGYSEHGGGTGFDMKVDPRTGDLFSVTGSMIAGMTFGNTGFRWRPQIEAGYRAVVSGNAGSTTTQFIGGTDPFTLAAETVKMNSVIGRIGLRIYSDYLDVLLDGGVAKASDYTDLDVHVTARTVF